MLKVLCDGCTPTKGSKYSAGIDLYASEDVVIMAGETAVVGLGVCIDLENFLTYGIARVNVNNDGSISNDNSDNAEEFMSSHYLELHPRSSLRAKGLIAGVGVIDLDFAGDENEIKIIIHNPIMQGVSNTFVINKGDKIAQILLKEHKGYLMGIESIEERVSGFGSTGE